MDLLMLLSLVPILGFINFGFQKSSSDAKSETGLRGTKYFDDAALGASQALGESKDLADEINRSQFGTFRGMTGNQMFDVGPYGLGASAIPAVNNMLNYSLNRVSASGAARGQLNPENAPGVAASATQNVLPQLLPQITQMAQWVYMLPEMWKQSLFGYRSNIASQYAPYLGGQSSASSSSFGTQVGVGGKALLPGQGMGAA